MGDCAGTAGSTSTPSVRGNTLGFVLDFDGLLRRELLLEPLVRGGGGGGGGGGPRVGGGVGGASGEERVPESYTTSGGVG